MRRMSDTLFSCRICSVRLRPKEGQDCYLLLQTMLEHTLGALTGFPNFEGGLASVVARRWRRVLRRFVARAEATSPDHSLLLLGKFDRLA